MQIFQFDGKNFSDIKKTIPHIGLKGKNKLIISMFGKTVRVNIGDFIIVDDNDIIVLNPKFFEKIKPCLSFTYHGPHA